MVSVSCGAHCTAAIAEPRENDGTISRRRLWVWGQNQVMLVTMLSVLFFAFKIHCTQYDLSLVFRLLIIHAYIGELLLQIRYSHNNSTFFFPFVCEKLFDFFFLLDMVQIISQVSCGAVHVIALSEDGLLQAWGIV